VKDTAKPVPSALEQRHSIPYYRRLRASTGLKSRFMTSLRSVLDEMGLAQYAQAFADEGFDTWATLMDITESDL